MNRIPKCTSKYYIHQPNNINPSQKESNKENLAQKISKKTLKFSASRQFGKDLTNNNRSNINSIYNNHSTKIITVIDKKQNLNNLNNIYIKKHSSLSQVAQKTQKIKSFSCERKLRDNKSNSMINKKNNDIIKKENTIQANQANYKLYSSISFGMNANNNNNNINNRPISSNNNSISVRLSNPKNGVQTTRYYGTINNRSINNIHNSNINHHNYNFNYSSIMNNNIKNDNLNHIHTHTTLDLM